MKRYILLILAIFTYADLLSPLVAVATAETGGTHSGSSRLVGWVPPDPNGWDGFAGTGESRESEIARRMARLEATVAQLTAQQRAADVGLAAHRHAASRAAQPAAGDKEPEADEEKPKKWYEKFGIRGYTQFRFNDAIYVSDGSARPHHAGDESVSDNRTFIIRRARIILSGDVSDRISIYFQPDFAVTPPGSSDGIHFMQLRDWYADIHFDAEKEYRIRVGQSKVPYGWENLQSSSNRLPLDRSDPLNSAVRNERDLGAFFYWTPTYAQDLFKFIMDEGLKGSSNYGVFGFGAYAGQGGSLREQNDSLHLVTRFTLPMCLDSGQIVEAGVQAYGGMYTVLSSPISPLGVGPATRPAGTLETGNARGIYEERIAGSFIWYPQPWGFQAEWTVGQGPGLNDAQTEVVQRPLHGGYVMTMYRIDRGESEWFPFIRWNYFKGGYRSARNAPFATIDELEVGLEWQINKQMEFVGMYTLTDRTNLSALSTAGTESYGQFEGSLLRFQFQINY
jgi:hypothetical protein